MCGGTGQFRSAVTVGTENVVPAVTGVAGVVGATKMGRNKEQQAAEEKRWNGHTAAAIVLARSLASVS